MFGIGVRIGWYGFGPKRDLFTNWFDLGVIGFGITPLVAMAEVRAVARRVRQIKDAIPRLVGKARS